MSIHNTRITHLEENGQNISDVIYTLGTSIEQIESSRTEDQEHIKAINKIIMRNITELNLNIANLEMNSTRFKTDIQDLYTNTSEIESDEAWNLALANILNNSIIDLQVDLGVQMQEIHDMNRSIVQIKETVDMKSQSIQNISDKLLAIDAESKLNIAATDANTESLSQLAIDVNVTMTLLRNLESSISYIKGKL